MKAYLGNTVKGSKEEGFYPQGWDIEKINDCCGADPSEAAARQAFWNTSFNVEALTDGYDLVEDWKLKVGFAIATQIRKAQEEGIQIALLLTGYPLGQYRWAAFFLNDWKVTCDHVHAFLMNDWSDANGATSGLMERGLDNYFFGKLDNPIPRSQIHAPTPTELPRYADAVTRIKSDGGRLVTVYGVGRAFDVAFWQPQWAADFRNAQDVLHENYRLAGTMNPQSHLTYAMMAFRGNFTLESAYVNTVGLGLILQSDYAIGGCDRLYLLGGEIYHSWQGLPLWVTLRHGPNPWVPSSYLPTLPGEFFYPEPLAQIVKGGDAQ